MTIHLINVLQLPALPSFISICYKYCSGLNVGVLDSEISQLFALHVSPVISFVEIVLSLHFASSNTAQQAVGLLASSSKTILEVLKRNVLGIVVDMVRRPAQRLTFLRVPALVLLKRDTVSSRSTPGEPEGQGTSYCVEDVCKELDIVRELGSVLGDNLSSHETLDTVTLPGLNLSDAVAHVDKDTNGENADCKEHKEGCGQEDNGENDLGLVKQVGRQVSVSPKLQNPHTQSDEQVSDGQIDPAEETHEMRHVSVSHGVVGPGTVVIHFENTHTQSLGMMGSLGLVSLALETVHLHAIFGRRVVFGRRSGRHNDGDDVGDPNHSGGTDEEGQLVFGHMVWQNVDGREGREGEDDDARDYHSYPRIGEGDHGG